MNGIDKSPIYFRGTVSHGEPGVFREGGVFSAGLITDVSVITRGEALGHDLWVDADFLSDVAGAINAAVIDSPESGGVKARFTHPGLSSDGVGQKLGRFRNAKVVGEQVIADLHFQEAATRTPDGNLADYVMTLAEETPEDFGLSIVFEHNVEAAELHQLENTHNNRYISPDEDNKNNYLHAQLGFLRSGDVVDSPAANPEGLFQRGQKAAQEGEQLLEYVLGLSDAKPCASCFSVDPDRAAIFVTRFLERHNLSISSIEKGDQMSESTDTPTADEAIPTREEFTAEANRYIDRFGAEDGWKWFNDGVSYQESLELQADSLQAQIKSLNEKIAELEEVIQSLDRGDEEGAEFSEDDEQPPQPERSLRNRIRIQGKAVNN